MNDTLGIALNQAFHNNPKAYLMAWDTQLMYDQISNIDIEQSGVRNTLGGLVTSVEANQRGGNQVLADYFAEKYFTLFGEAILEAP